MFLQEELLTDLLSEKHSIPHLEELSRLLLEEPSKHLPLLEAAHL
jgi:hypothetical protein